MGQRQFQAVLIRGGKQLLRGLINPISGFHSMDDICCVQISGLGDPGFSGRTPDSVLHRNLFLCGRQLRPGCPVNCTIHPAAAQHL